ncbi:MULTISPECIES: hypothetical protein [Eikenella]|nr:MULTISPECIES: hypothetical protein [Eikenella]
MGQTERIRVVAAVLFLGASMFSLRPIKSTVFSGSLLHAEEAT